MGKQLSLFSEHSNTAYNPKIKVMRLYITIDIICEVCKHVIHIERHEAILSEEFMRKNWQYVGNNHFLKSGVCSRECIQKLKNASDKTQT